MCYQVIERYSRCRCLYYKHAIDPCAAHGERGHTTQEKTVLVGYACSLHSDYLQDSGVIDIVDSLPDLDDSSDDGQSIFSLSIALSRCTSFIASDGQDTIAEVLEVLLQDPQLSWQDLLHSQTTTTTETRAKDVQFFLGAFERDLRAQSDSTLQHHACASLRCRLRYLSSEIYKHFNVEEITTSDSYCPDNESVTGSLRQLQPIGTDEPDPTLMPAFSVIREFLFDGTAYEALKENVRNFAQHTRNYRKEMVDIMVRNLHPPSEHLGSPRNVDSPRLFNLFDVFLADLAKEAEIHMISASDRAGIKSVHEKLSKLAARIYALWTDEVPSWHFYPLIPSSSSCESFTSSSANVIESQGEVETFETFVCSSRAFWCLTKSVSPHAYKITCEPNHV